MPDEIPVFSYDHQCLFQVIRLLPSVHADVLCSQFICVAVFDNMLKRKCQFTNEKVSCFRRGREDFEAECKLGTFVSVISVTCRGGLDLQSHVDSGKKHTTAVRKEASVSKLTHFFVKPGSKIEQVSSTEGIFAFHIVASQRFHRDRLHIRLTEKPHFLILLFLRTRKNTDGRNPFLAPHSVENIFIQENDISYCVTSKNRSNHGSVKLFPVVIEEDSIYRVLLLA